MRHQDKYVFLLLRMLSMLVVGDMMEDVPYAIDLEAAHMTIFQVYIANAGLVLPSPCMRYCGSFTTHEQASKLRLDCLHRAAVEVSINWTACVLPINRDLVGTEGANCRQAQQRAEFGAQTGRVRTHEVPFLRVSEMVGFGLGRSKMLYPSMGID